VMVHLLGPGINEKKICMYLIQYFWLIYKNPRQTWYLSSFTRDECDRVLIYKKKQIEPFCIYPAIRI